MTNPHIRPPAMLAALACLGFVLPACGTLSVPPGTNASSEAQTRSQSPATDSCLTNVCLYVTNYHNQYYVSAFRTDATGNIPPSQVIGGGDTSLAGFGLAVDAGRNVYVSNEFGRSVTVYAAGAGGDALPIQTIYGRQTRLRRPADLALDAAGDIVVIDRGKNSKNAGSITVYPPGSTGDVTPIRRVFGPSTGLALPAYVAVGSDGDIYVANSGFEDGDSVTVYSPTADGNASPIRTITGSNTQLIGLNGIALDASNNLYVASLSATGSVVNEFAAGANGNVAPIRTIGGSDTLLDGAMGVALDSSGTIYVSNAGQGTRRRHYHSFVTVYAANASGDAAPIAVIQGNATMLSTSQKIFVR